MKGVYITSKLKNKYFYNDDTGFIEIIREKTDENEDICHVSEDEQIRWAKVEEVKDHLIGGSGFKHLILEVTEDCNMACKYCCFGEHYKNSRPPSRKMMSFETLKKSIDYYMHLFKNKKYLNPAKNPAIGFYGGEPLVNFKLIKEAIKYLEEEYSEFKIDYNLTTNSLLMTEEVMDLLYKKDFSVAISLDGNKENHDRNRITSDGFGTFDTVMSKVSLFRRKYPNFKKLTFSTCYDYRTNLFDLKDFIKENDLFIVAMNMISSLETNYYDEFTESEKWNFYSQFLKLQDEFLDLAKTNNLSEFKNDIYSPLFLAGYFQLCAHSLIGQKRRDFLPFGGSCVPGEKIYVTCDGVFHACERITHNFPIGDIENGLDYEKITELVNEFNKNQNNCCNCKVTRLCSLCIAKMTLGDKIVFDTSLCKRIYDDNVALLTNYINIMEENPEGFDKLTANYFRDLSFQTNGVNF